MNIHKSTISRRSYALGALVALFLFQFRRLGAWSTETCSASLGPLPLFEYCSARLVYSAKIILALIRIPINCFFGFPIFKNDSKRYVFILHKNICFFFFFRSHKLFRIYTFFCFFLHNYIISSVRWPFRKPYLRHKKNDLFHDLSESGLCLISSFVFFF